MNIEDLAKQEPIISEALQIACQYHSKQTRKFSGDLYVTHPIRVAQSIWDAAVSRYENENGWVALRPGILPVIAAALLHDTVEDTDIHLEVVDGIPHGEEVLAIVLWVTDDKSLRGNRRLRKRATCERLSRAPYEARLIKMVDRVDNVEDFLKYDRKFLQKKYAEESFDLAEALTRSDTNSRPWVWSWRLLQQFNVKLLTILRDFKGGK